MSGRTTPCVVMSISDSLGRPRRSDDERLDRTTTPSNESGFIEMVTLTVINNGPHVAEGVAFEVPTPELSYDMSPHAL